MEEVDFQFDAATLLGQIKKVTDSWDSMTNTMEATEKVNPKIKKTEQQTASVGKAGKESGFLMTASFTKLLGVFGLLTGAIGAMKGAIQRMPEVAMTMEIAGDIFMRNFLQPIRQNLVPVLNDILAWVRDNRTQFVKWGAIVFNVFQVVFSIAESFFNLISTLFESMMSTIKGAFGGTVASLENIIRVILTKIAAVFTFIEILLTPLFDAIGNAIGVVVVGIKKFFDGFMEGLARSGAVEALDDFVQIFTDIINAIFGGENAASKFGQVMGWLGKIIGFIIGTAFKIFVKILRFVADILIFVIEQVLALGGWLSQFLGPAFEMIVGIGEDVVDIVDMVISGFRSFINVIRGMGTWINRNIMGPIGNLITGLKKIAVTVGNFFTKVFDGVKKVIQDTLDWINDAIDSVKEFLGLSGNAQKVQQKNQRQGIQTTPPSPAIQTQGGTQNNTTNATVNQNVNINVTSPNPQQAGQQVQSAMGQQGRSAANMVKKSIQQSRSNRGAP